MSSIMLRRNGVRMAKSVLAGPSFTQARGLAEGSTGGYRGEQGGDAFSKREKAQEDLYVRQHEAEKIKQLRAEIAAKEAEIAKLKEDGKK